MLIQKKANQFLSVTVLPMWHVKEEKQTETFCIYNKTIRKRVLECKDANEDKYCEIHKQTFKNCLQDNNTISIRNKSGLYICTQLDRKKKRLKSHYSGLTTLLAHLWSLYLIFYLFFSSNTFDHIRCSFLHRIFSLCLSKPRTGGVEVNTD